MFTGLITAIGEILAVSDTHAGRELVVAAPYTGLVLGESIACNGACLTVREIADGSFTVAAVVTTRDRTAIGSWDVGTRVNLERAMAVGDRLGGHLVQGHVDEVGTVECVGQREDAWLVDVRVPDAIADLLVPRGSIAVDGVSLTVVELPEPTLLRLSIIEHTLRHTTLGALRAGDRVHLEADMLAKHLKRLAAPLLHL
jgi:riboflavin synthase